MLAISSSSIAKASSSVRPRWFVFLLPHSVAQALKSPPITIGSVCVRVRVRVHACVHACGRVRACVRACVRAYVHACVCVCAYTALSPDLRGRF